MHHCLERCSVGAGIRVPYDPLSRCREAGLPFDTLKSLPVFRAPLIRVPQRHGTRIIGTQLYAINLCVH